MRRIVFPTPFDLVEIAVAPIDLSKGKRQGERSAALSIVRELTADETADIAHNCDGAPILVTQGELVGKLLSVSHSEGLVAVALSDSAVGIDLQYPSPKLRRVESRFVGDGERQLFSETEKSLNVSRDTMLLIAWTIKEAVYKLFSKRGVPLTEIVIERFAKCAGLSGEAIVAEVAVGDERSKCCSVELPGGAMLTMALKL